MNKLVTAIAVILPLCDNEVRTCLRSPCSIALPTFYNLITGARPLMILFQRSIVEASMNAYLIKKEGKLILVDEGAAELYGPTLGHLPANLIKAGYQPEQINAV